MPYSSYLSFFHLILALLLIGGCSQETRPEAKRTNTPVDAETTPDPSHAKPAQEPQVQTVKPTEPLFSEDEVATAKQMVADLGVYVQENGDGQIVVLDTAKNRSWVDDYQLQDMLKLEHLQNLTVEGPSVTDEFTAALSGLPNLESLTMKNTLISDVGVKAFTELKKLKIVDLRLSPLISDQAMAILAEMSQLRAVRLSGVNQLSDAGVESLLSIPNLSELDLRNCRNLSKSTFEKLTEKKSLRTLKLGGGSVTDEILEVVGKMSQLTGLSLDVADVTDSGVMQLANLPLRDFTIYQCSGVTDAGTQCIATMGELQKLTLRDLRSDGDALSKLPNPEKLRVLNLSQTDFGDNQVSQLVSMKNLSELTLIETQLTDAAVDGLGKLSSLKKLLIMQTSMTSAGIERLQGLLPVCAIRAN